MKSSATINGGTGGRSVLVVDAHALVRVAIGTVLESTTQWRVVGDTSDASTAISLAKTLKPDLVVIDVDLPAGGAITATAAITSARSGPRVLGLCRPRGRDAIIALFAAGASLCLFTTETPDAFLTAVSDAFLTAVSDIRERRPRGTAAVQNYLAESLETSSIPASRVLTPREVKVAQLIADGASTREAAEVLGVSANTVECQRRSIMVKLKLTSVAALTKYAIRAGLIDLYEAPPWRGLLRDRQSLEDHRS